MCDTIRHSGLASIQKTLTVRKSNLSQLKIVEKTKALFLEKGRFPLPEEVDASSVATTILPIEVATLEKVEVPEKWKDYKGFFTKNFFSENFSVKFLDYLY